MLAMLFTACFVRCEIGRPGVSKSSCPVGRNHFLDPETGRPGVIQGRTKSLSASSIFHSIRTKEQAMNRVEKQAMDG